MGCTVHGEILEGGMILKFKGELRMTFLKLNKLTLRIVHKRGVDPFFGWGGGKSKKCKSLRAERAAKLKIAYV